MQITSDQKRRIHDYIPLYIEFLKSTEGKALQSRDKQFLTTCSQVLNRDNLVHASLEDIKSVLMQLYSQDFWKDKSSYIDKNIIEANGFRKLVHSLEDFLYGERNFNDRYDDFRRVRGMGPAVSTEILSCCFPEKYAMWNARSVGGLKLLGLDDESFTGEDITADAYQYFNDILRLLSEELSSAGQRQKIFDIHLFLYFVSKSSEEKLKLYLGMRFPDLKIDRFKRNWLRLPDQEAYLYVNESKEHKSKNEGFYDLEAETFDQISKKGYYYAVSLVSPAVTFVIPNWILEQIFQQSILSDSDLTTKKRRWMFLIWKKEDDYVLRVNKSGAKEHSIGQYLDNWSQIRGIGQIKEISSDHGLTDTDMECIALGMMIDTSPYFSDVTLPTLTRWTNALTPLRAKRTEETYESWLSGLDVEVLNEIYDFITECESKIEKSLVTRATNVQNLSKEESIVMCGFRRAQEYHALRANMNAHKYTVLKNQFPNAIRNTPNHWIFVVTDRPEVRLSGYDVVKVRTSQKFWGLNKGTAYRTHLRSGDYVIFSYGAKEFIGSATLASDSFMLTGEQKERYSNGQETFRSDFGVLLTNIELWDKPRSIRDYLHALSFIKETDNFPAYFQGGIKKITDLEYDALVGKAESIPAKTVTAQLEEFPDEPLPFPTPDSIRNGLEELREELLIDESTLFQIVVNLASGRHILLAGPVGTGKTRLAQKIADVFWKEKGGYFAEIHTATSDWMPQDVIGGIMPAMKNEQPVYDISLGCVASTVKKNWSTITPNNRSYHIYDGIRYRGTWLIIDEFNRADIDKAFGQLITALTTNILTVPVSEHGISYKQIRIPKDYRIIGTLNAVDKHFLFKLSDALKRRFAFIEVLPPPRTLRDTEIYYALNNAVNELENLSREDLVNQIIFDDNTKSIRQGNDAILYDSLMKAYDVLDAVREAKPLGTAILKSIYQTLIVALRLTGDATKSLDMALYNNILPQLESLRSTSLKILFNRLFSSDIKFLRQIYEDPEREQYYEDIEILLSSIGVSNPSSRAKEFSTNKLKDEAIWKTIEDSFSKKKIELESVIFRRALQDLLRSSDLL